MAEGRRDLRHGPRLDLVKGKTVSDNNPHASYVPPAISENMPRGFAYVGRPGTDRGLSGQAVTPRYSEDNDEDD
jgi:hypothetical protein